MTYGEAAISPDGLYRYVLARYDGVPDEHSTEMVFVMLNPSTADADQDDPTIRRCLAFARREGCDVLTVVNLYAYRATSPRALWTVADPVGPENDAYLTAVLAAADRVVCAWGVNARPDRVRAVHALMGADVEPLALGVTKDGHPRHPLYVRGDAPLIPYNPLEALR